MHESRVGVSEHCVTVSWDHSALSQGLTNIFFDDFAARLLALVVVSELSQPFQAFLIGKAV